MTDHCPVCGAGEPRGLLTLEDMPVLCNQLWPDRESARGAPRGDIVLALCGTCGHVWNRHFDPARMVYSPGYENALHHSPVFRRFAEDLADHLVRAHELPGRHVVEIGCGDGYMLDLLVARGAASATGFDPSMKGRRTPFAERAGVQIVPALFDERQLDRDFDIVICRHVLEHLEAPRALLAAIRGAIGDRDVPVYFEVPNAEWMMAANSIWDVIYEHVGYWSAASIGTAFHRAAFELTSVRTGYGGQFLMVEGRPRGPGSGPDAETPPDGTVALAERFRIAADRELAAWRARLGGLAGAAVVWGAGSKGITFANAMGAAGHGRIAAMVDLNPRKHGAFVPGAALEVVAPDALRVIRPDLVLVSNALYRDEIVRMLGEAGLTPEVEVIAG